MVSVCLFSFFPFHEVGEMNEPNAIFSKILKPYTKFQNFYRLYNEQDTDMYMHYKLARVIIKRSSVVFQYNSKMIIQAFQG